MRPGMGSLDQAVPATVTAAPSATSLCCQNSRRFPGCGSPARTPLGTLSHPQKPRQPFPMMPALFHVRWPALAAWSSITTDLLLIVTLTMRSRPLRTTLPGDMLTSAVFDANTTAREVVTTDSLKLPCSPLVEHGVQPPTVTTARLALSHMR